MENDKRSLIIRILNFAERLRDSVLPCLCRSALSEFSQLGEWLFTMCGWDSAAGTATECDGGTAG